MKRAQRVPDALCALDLNRAQRVPDALCALERRILGKTGLSVSALGFGCSPLGGVFRPVDKAECVGAVHAALDCGINFFDVAPYYGATQAESVLGEALRGVERDRYVLATKVGRYGDGDFDFSPKRVIASVSESLSRLQTDYIDLIQCHDIEYGDLDRVANETLPALETLRANGKVRFIGITGFPLHIFPYLLDRGQADTVLSYCHYTLANRELTGLLPRLEAERMGIINAAPLCMGLLTNAGPPAWHPANGKLRERCAAAALYCEAQGVDIATLALQFAIAERRIHTTVIGMATASEVERNVGVMSQAFDRELVAEVSRRIRG